MQSEQSQTESVSALAEFLKFKHFTDDPKITASEFIQFFKTVGNGKGINLKVTFDGEEIKKIENVKINFSKFLKYSELVTPRTFARKKSIIMESFKKNIATYFPEISIWPELMIFKYNNGNFSNAYSGILSTRIRTIRKSFSDCRMRK